MKVLYWVLGGLCALVLIIIMQGCSMSLQVENGHAVSSGEGQVSDHYDPEAEGFKKEDDNTNSKRLL